MWHNFRKLFFSVIITITFFFTLVAPSKAVTCSNWDCTTIKDPDYPWGWSQKCVCTDCFSCTTCDCGPGSYCCNRDTQCCPYNVPNPGPPPVPEPGPGPVPPATCSVTAPSNLVVTKVGTTAELKWTPGINGWYQALWISTNPDPQTGCAGTSGGTSVCPVRLDVSTTTLPEEANIYSVSGLDENAVYYVKIMNVQSTNCYYSTYTLFPCDLIPSPLTITQGRTRSVISTVPSGTGIDHVTFASNNSNITVNPTSDPTFLYSTLVRAISQGTSTITSDVYITGGFLACTSQLPVTILPPLPWWQVKDSDIQSVGDLTNGIPLNTTYFDLDGDGGFPGVASYGTSTDLTSTSVSSTGWLAQSLPVNQRTYDYAYFANQIPDDILAITNSIDTADVAGSLTSGDSLRDADDYYWYKYDGAVNGNQSLTIPEVDIGTRKVILMVDNADVNIVGNINLTDGQGFFMLVVDGNINVDSTVGGGIGPNLEGMYLASGSFNDGLGNTQFTVRGSVVGNTGVNMQRDLGDTLNGSDPSEFFEYAPDQIMLYPSKLGIRKLSWKEVAP